MSREAIRFLGLTTVCLLLVMILDLGSLSCDAAALAEEQVYSDKYDHIDVQNILDNERKRENYYNCFVGKAPCTTADARFFKEKFPEAIVTKCRKCTPRQVENFERIIVYYTTNEPQKWKDVLSKAISEFKRKNEA